MVPSRQAPDLLAGQWQLIAGLGAAPKALVWDNESAIGQWRGGRPQLTEATNAFRGTLRPFPAPPDSVRQSPLAACQWARQDAVIPRLSVIDEGHTYRAMDPTLRMTARSRVRRPAFLGVHPVTSDWSAER